MADAKKQCMKCSFWGGANGHYCGSKISFCHHLLCTGQRREEVDGVCRSFRLKVRKHGSA